MIRLVFNFQREVMRFKVEDRNIYYTDRKWSAWIRCIPKDEDFIKKILLSRNKIPKVLIQMFNLSKKDQEEYDNAKTDEELADIIIRDCKMKGVILTSRENTKDGVC